MYDDYDEYSEYIVPQTEYYEFSGDILYTAGYIPRTASDQ